MTSEKAKYQALKYLSFRPRATQEVRTYLEKKEYSPEIIAEVIAYLKTYSYLDDDKFCQLWIENRCRLKPRGKKGLFFELKNKGIDSSLIEQNINQSFPPEMELEMARALVLKKMQGFNNNSLKAKERIIAHLYRRGFSNSVIQTIICELKLPNSS